jgi:hypothetical protein
LFRADFLDLCPDASKFILPGLVHIQARSQTQSSKSDHNAADFLMRFANVSVKDVIN